MSSLTVAKGLPKLTDLAVEIAAEFGNETDPTGVGPFLAATVGQSANTFASLAAFRAASTTTFRTATLAVPGGLTGPFYFETANAPYVEDGVNTIKADDTPLSTGAWVRQGADKVAQRQIGLGAVNRSIAEKFEEMLSVKDYGAIGDGTLHTVAEWIIPGALGRFVSLAALQVQYPHVTATTDSIDWAAIQAACDAAENLGGQTRGEVRIQAGAFVTTDTIQVGRGIGVFTSVFVRGEGKRYRAEPGFSGTVILPTFSDRPAFAISGGRNSSIRSLSIRGKNFEWIESNNLGVFATPDIDDVVAANWVDPALSASASSRYAPYAGIAIDPYAGTAPATPYPGATYGRAFSANTLIDDVEITGFVDAVTIQPSGADGNGDFTKIENCVVEYCQYALSIGNTQSRLVRLSNTIIHNVHTGIVTGKRGRQQGKPQVLVDSTTIAFCIQWFDCPTLGLGGTLEFNNCYGETVWRIGDGATAGGVSRYSPVAFRSCEWYFDRTYRGAPASVLNSAGGGGVSFDDCTFSATSDHNNYHFMGDARAYHFRNCIVWAGDEASELYEKHALNATAGITFSQGGYNVGTFSIRAEKRWNLNSGASVGAVNINDSPDQTARTTGIPIYAKRLISAAAYEADGGFLFLSGVNPIGKAAMEIVSSVGRVVTLNMTGAIADWQLIQSGGEVGDFIVDDATETVFFVAARTGLTVTLVAQNNYDADGDLRTPITLSGTLWAQNCRRYTPFFATYGDYTSGNNVITNIARGDGFAGFLNNADTGLQVNDFVFSGSGVTTQPVTPVEARISALGSGTITVVAAASYTAPRQRQTLFIRAAPANVTP